MHTDKIILIFSIVQFLVTTVLFNCSIAQDNYAYEPDATKQKLFEEEDLLYVYILADFDSILNDRTDSAGFHKAELWCFDDTCNLNSMDVKIKTRGNFRLNPDHCSFPPLLIKFKTEETNNTIFHGQKKIKMITHCEADKYVLREYIIYKMYNILTDKSYHVRLAQIHYINNGNKNDTTINYACFLENSKLMAARNGGKTIKNQKISKTDLDMNYTTILYLFQFMIGNTDWDIDLQKNVKFMDLHWYDKIIPVPYDFDWSEIVNAPYIMIDAYVGSGPLNRRKLKSIDRNFNEYKVAIKYYISKKKEIYELVNSFQYLSYQETQEILKYLDVFYNIIEKRRLTAERFLKLIEKSVEQNLKKQTRQ